MDEQKEPKQPHIEQPRQGGEMPLPESAPEKELPEGKGDDAISQELRREIELMEIEPDLKEHALEKAQKIRLMAQDDKLQNLLDMAKQKGVVFAIKVAQSMNDPYILDTFHDLLAREGLYKDFKT